MPDPKAVVANWLTIFEITKALKTKVRPIAEYRIVFFDLSRASGLPELVI